MANYRPSAYSGGFASPVSAFDNGYEDTSTAASANARSSGSTVQVVSEIWGGFASVTGLNTLTLKVMLGYSLFDPATHYPEEGSGSDLYFYVDPSITVSYSRDGGSTWIEFYSAATDGSGDVSPLPLLVSAAVPAPSNLNLLQVKATVTGGYASIYNSEIGHTTYFPCTGSISICDIYAEGENTRSPILDHSAPTSTGKTIYPANKFDSTSGTLGIATDTPSIFTLDGTNGYYYYEGAS